ncbi:centromere protein C isoform X3 [Petaurus breviceps papuanus]|uniref:centromere protein C isoform X3 n=1 Tax=Petaurus breviceps papuanus TaxID=3040969 RepID=UPI0036DC1AE5
MRLGNCGVVMASSDLDHLKISYRTRFCCASRIPDTDLWQGQNVLENIQDCFEEKNSFLGSDTGFSTNPGSPTLCSTPCKLRNDSYYSPDKESKISPSKSGRISSMKKKCNTSAFSQHCIMLQNWTNNNSGDLVGLKNTPNLRYASSGAEEFNKIPNEVLEEFYLTVGSPGLLAKEAEILPLPQQASPTTQDRWSYVFRNSVIQQPLLPKSRLKSKKSLNCEDIAVRSAVKKTEKNVEVSEGRQKRKQSESSEQIIQDPKQKIQEKTKMNFSTLLLEAAERNCRDRHVSSPQIRSPSPIPNDLESSNDEFIIDESDCAFSEDWILIPKKNSKSVKQSKTTPVENTQELERKKSRIEQQKEEKCSSASDKHPDTENGISDVISGEKTSKSIKHKVQAAEKSQSSKRKKLDNLSCEVGDASKSTRHKIYSEESEQFLKNERTVVQHQSEKCDTQIDNRQSDKGLVNFAEESQNSFHSEHSIAEVDTALRTTKSKTNSVGKSQTTRRRRVRKHKNKRFSTSQKDQRESDRSLGQREEQAESCHSAEQMLSVAGKEKNSSGASQQIQKKGRLNKTKSKNQQPSNKRIITQKQNQSPKFTVTRSQRISKRPCNWWVVSTEQSNMFYSPTLELPVNHKKKPKPSQKTKKISIKTLGKETIPFIQQKSSISAKLKEASIPRKQKRKKLSYSSDENCDMAHTVPKSDEQEDSLKETTRKKNVACSSTAEPLKERISDVQNADLTPTVSISGSKTLVTSSMEESGPARLRSNILTSTNNKAFGDEQECDTYLPDKMPCPLRSTRTKMKSLECCRGERVDSEGGFAVNGTVSNGQVSSRKKSNRERGEVNTDSCEDEQKKKAIAALNVSLGDPLKPTCVFDQEREQMVFRELVKLKGTHDFCVQDDSLKMFKILNTSLFATGTLILEPFKEKGKQYVCSDTVVFFIVSGDLICTLHETSYNLTSGDIFYVPSGNFYNIKNLLNERSILLFTQIKSEKPEK